MKDVVLVVDDSLTVRMDLADAFEAAGFEARPYATAAAAREAIARGGFDAVVLDVQRPDGDGVELLEGLRAAPGGEQVAVLLLSTAVEVKDRSRGFSTGADEYVGKPYDLGYVVARTRELIRAHRSGATSPTETVLVVDDSVTFREELRTALERAGYEVLLAGSGEEGLWMAADRRPNALVVDGLLPGIDGATVIRTLRLDAALRGLPCLLLTASDDPGAELRALDAGADAFVRKEEDVEVILARLAAVLRRAPGLAPEPPASLLGPRRILAVDDSRTYLEALATALRREGYDVVLAHSGEEALELLAVQPVDCVLLDLMMPGLSGQETCQRIKAAPVVREIPLIMLTALEDRNAMLEGLGAGADDYISKSADFEVLSARVRAQLRRKQFEDENRLMREELLRSELEAAEARAARELARARASMVEELERKNAELEAFSYSVSHDLRAPLRAIDGFSQMLVEDFAAGLDEQAQLYLRRIRAAARRMGELIDDLLSLSRVGRQGMTRETIDLSALAREVLAELRDRDPQREVAIEIAAGLMAEADRHLIRVLFDNLLGNAWKFTSKTARPRLEVGAEPGEKDTVFFVRDNGAGFDGEFAGQLFRPFHRLHAEVDFPGTGIGLATVQRIVQKHGGRIWAEGRVGLGAIFRFTLPSAGRWPELENRRTSAPGGQAAS